LPYEYILSFRESAVWMEYEKVIFHARNQKAIIAGFTPGCDCWIMWGFIVSFIRSSKVTFSHVPEPDPDGVFRHFFYSDLSHVH
jgi:hypothetical protein